MNNTVKKSASRLKIPLLLAYLLTFYGLWTLWEFFGAPWLQASVHKQWLVELLSSGVVKNAVWTLPAGTERDFQLEFPQKPKHSGSRCTAYVLGFADVSLLLSQTKRRSIPLGHSAIFYPKYAAISSADSPKYSFRSCFRISCRWPSLTKFRIV